MISVLRECARVLRNVAGASYSYSGVRVTDTVAVVVEFEFAVTVTVTQLRQDLGVIRPLCDDHVAPR